MRNVYGFTLVELMVVIAVLGILAAIAAPSYTRYIDRGYLTEGVTVLGEYKTSLGVYFSTKGHIPNTNDTLPGGPVDLPVGTRVADNEALPKTVESITYTVVNENQAGQIALVYTEDAFPNTTAGNRTIHLGVKVVGNKVIFECGNGSETVSQGSCCGFVDEAILPKGCNYLGVQSWLRTQ